MLENYIWDINELYKINYLTANITLLIEVVTLQYETVIIELSGW